MKSGGAKKSLPRYVWGFLTSRKVAVALLLTTAVMLLIGLWLPQVPSDLDPASLEQWWTLTQARYGPRLDLYERLGLLDLFRTPTFLALLAAMLLNLLCCTVDRLGPLWRAAVRRPVVRLPDTAYDKAHWFAEGVSLHQARRALHRRVSRLWQEEGSTGHFLLVERFRWASLGTVLTHFGLFLLALAALLHTSSAWRERLLLDPPSPTTGKTSVRLRHDPECAVRGLSFEARGGQSGQPRSWGQIQVAEGERLIEGWIGPAAPFSACGANFYLYSYGLALQVHACDEDNQPLEVDLGQENSDWLRFAEGTTEGSVDIPALGWRAAIVPSPEALIGLAGATLNLRLEQAGTSQPLFEGTVRSGEGLSLPGGRLDLQADYFLIVEAVRDPGVGAFVAAGLALFLGSTTTLLFPPRRTWAFLGKEGTLRVRFDLAREAARREEIVALERRLSRVSTGESP